MYTLKAYEIISYLFYMLLLLFLSGVPPYLSTDKIESLLQIKRYSYINLYIQCNLTDFVFNQP